MTTDFDFEALMAKPWEPPTAQVQTPTALILHGAPQYFTVRMATAEEMARANDALKLVERRREMIEGLSDLGAKRQAEIYKQAVGLSSNPAHDEFVKQVEFVVMCTVSPPLNFERALWLSRFQPLFFKWLFLKIMELCQEGAMPGEAPPSTETPESA